MHLQFTSRVAHTISDADLAWALKVLQRRALDLSEEVTAAADGRPPRPSHVLQNEICRLGCTYGDLADLVLARAKAEGRA
jgi:hypothetical protein